MCHPINFLEAINGKLFAQNLNMINLIVISRIKEPKDKIIYQKGVNLPELNTNKDGNNNSGVHHSPSVTGILFVSSQYTVDTPASMLEIQR